MGRCGWRLLTVLGLVSLCWAQAAAETDSGPVERAPKSDAPPAFFLALGAEAPGYHVNTKMPDGFVARTLCPAQWPSKKNMTVKGWARVSAAKGDCRALQRSFVTSLVRDKKEGGQYVVQELWLWEYDTPEAARRAAKNMDDMTFEKHPYEVWIRGPQVVILEQRWRFRSAGKALAQYVAGRLKESEGWGLLRPLTK